MDIANQIPAADLKYLVTKRSLLSNPGTKLDGIYYSDSNSSVELAEVGWVNGRYRQDLTSLGFGSQSQVVIPNQNLLSTLWLHLELPPVLLNNCLPRGWGYAAIQSINYLFGSSNVSQLTISGPSLLQVLVGQAETSEKFGEILRLGGDETSGPSDTSSNVVADIILPFPWSTANGLNTKLPFDTNILANPITITIQFNSANNIYGGSGAAPSGFAAATVLARQGDMTNKDQSLRSIMASNPALLYGYPFIHAQSYQVNFTGITAPASPYTGMPASFVTANLLGFQNSDLVGISWAIIETSKLTNGASPPRPLDYELPSNVQLYFNGQRLYDAPKFMTKSYNMYSQIGSSAIANSAFRAGQTVSPFISDPVDTYIIYMDFSRIRAYSFDGDYQNVPRVGNNTLVLNFTTATTNSYILYATYHYNAIAECQAGETRIYMD